MNPNIDKLLVAVYEYRCSVMSYNYFPFCCSMCNDEGLELHVFRCKCGQKGMGSKDFLWFVICDIWIKDKWGLKFY